MSEKLFEAKDIIKRFKDIDKKIHDLYCFIEKCCAKIPTNIGGGAKLFKRLYNNKWEFKTILPGSNVTITEQDDTITINSTGGGTITCEDVDICLGISPEGSPTKLLNEQGDFITISGSGFTCSDLDICDTDSLKEGDLNFYYTQSRFNSDFATKTTTNLAEGTNLYFTNPRAISALTGQNISIFTNNLNYVRDIDLAPYLLSTTAAVTYQPIGSYLTFAITSLNGLTNSSQTFVNDTNVTLTSTGTTHTLGWTGTLADSRIASASIWSAKQNALGFTPEDVANKSSSFTSSSTTTYANTKALVDGLATKQNRPLAQALNTSINIASATPVVIFTEDLSTAPIPITLEVGDILQVRIVGNLLNNSGGARTYTHYLQIGSLLLTIIDGTSVAANATNESVHEIEATICISATNFTAIYGELDRGVAGAIDTGQSIAVTTVRKAWNETTSDLTGSQTFTYSILSAGGATTTQTFKLRVVIITPLKSNM